MNKVLTNLKRLFKQLRGFFPVALPTGMPEFSNFIDDLMFTYWMPTASKDDIIFVVTSTIVRLDPTTIAKPKWYFAKVIRAAASKQIAGANFQDVKIRNQEKQKQAEVPAPKATSDVPQTG